MRAGCTLIAYLDAKPEKRDELLAILNGLVRETRREPGCIDYHLHVSERDPNVFIFYENWKSREALDRHFEMPYLKDFWNQRLDLLTKDVDIQYPIMLSDFPE